MRHTLRFPRLAASLLAIALLVASGGPSTAKPPTLSALFPPGAERGQSLSVKASGTFDHWPVKCWVDGDGLSVEPAKEKGVLSVVVAADAMPGVRWIRIYDRDGATGLRPFVVGPLPEIAEAEPNDDPRTPQRIGAARVTVNGRLAKKGDVDGFAVELKAGAVLVADVEANRRLGSPMDGVLQVASADGFVLEQDDDAGGLDPRIVFRAPADGSYLVRLFAFPATPGSDIQFAGGSDYIYRLTLTTGGFLDHAFPLAVPPGGPSKVSAVGPNVPGSGPDSALDIPPGDRPERLTLSHPRLAGSVQVRRVPGAVAVEVEPDGIDKAQPLADLASVSGRIDPPGDRDAYRIALKKGETRVFRLESRAFGLPLDAVMAVFDAGGKPLAETDDVGESRDPELRFTPAADGDFRVVVRDLHGRGGPRYAYLLGVISPEPDFGLSLAADLFELPPGKPAKVAVTIDRHEGFAGEVELHAEGLPAGVTSTTAVSRPGDASAKAVTLELQGSATAPPGPFRIVGRAVRGDHRERPARARIAGFEAETDRPWLSVLPAPAPAKP
ncbi:putative subtilase-type serine protease precursor [Aquisphaera giovannonii]|uniref:Putative subtilase-type serine protease n=1 Tax=Aquisphaera giovannonii TaxID=406548 RepID=A0A5B9W377_9BACT|nr:pre-peptidase [Aquisphaera giovannonii]QEH35042.1 putative subtilase-type serine protease precursor [Aquisphaera giovannonii]